MFKPIQAPYLTPDSSVVAAEDWHLLRSSERVRLPEFLDDWTPGASLQLSRNIEVDRGRLLEQAHLPRDAELAVAVSWISGSSKIRRRVFRAAVGEEPLNVMPTLNGDEIGGKVTVRTSIILNSPLEGENFWIAHEVGSVLLSEEVSVSLDRSESGFPMAVIDFAASPYPAGASWHLETTTVLESRFTSGFQVLINDRDKKLVKAMEASNPSKEQRVLLDDLMAGVMTQTLMLAYALRRAGELDLEGHEFGSVGEVLANLIKRTNDLPIDVSADPSRWSLMRTQFEDMVRTLGIGRVF